MPIIEIPVEFEYEGISFKGHFYQANGAGGSWHLNLNGYYYGKLVNYITGQKWCPNINNWFAEPFMEDYFIRLINGK